MPKFRFGDEVEVSDSTLPDYVQDRRGVVYNRYLVGVDWHYSVHLYGPHERRHMTNVNVPEGALSLCQD